MSFAKVFSGAVIGLEPYLVEVEVNIDYQGFVGFNIVGLASREIDESKERVRSAIKNSHISFPNRRITVNLAPAYIPKKGSFYDLPIAIGILKAAGLIKVELYSSLVLGELSLNGELNPVSGVIPLVTFAKKHFKEVYLPEVNAEEASIISGIQIKPVKNLTQIIEHFNFAKPIKSISHKNWSDIVEKKPVVPDKYDFSHIKGQQFAKRALEIAAAGGHNVSLIGPPGVGKTLLAKALSGILPKLTEEEALEVTEIYSIAGKLNLQDPFVTKRPFRSPHHSTSKAGLIGGGNPITPGEISLAHRGLLFIDEFPELSREVIEAIRQPIEYHEIEISRAQGIVKYPSNFMLVIAANPCPCGYLGHPQKECTCYDFQIKKYREKISGPILDRIDLNVECLPVTQQELSTGNDDIETTFSIASRVQKARDIQKDRYLNEKGIFCNADLESHMVKKYCSIGDQTRLFLDKASQRLNLSARSYYKIVKISRTIADLSESKEIMDSHIAEALQYRIRS